MKTEELRMNLIVYNFIQKYTVRWNSVIKQEPTWTLNNDNSVDIEGEFIIYHYTNPNLPFKIRNVNGQFGLKYDNNAIRNFTDFENFPDRVNGYNNDSSWWKENYEKNRE